MSAPLPAEPGLTVAGLAETWAAAASQTTYLPMSGDELGQLLTRLLNRLVTAVAAAPMDGQAAAEVAAELFAHDLTGSTSISRSIEVLDDGLPRLAELRHVDGSDAAVSRALRTPAGGYAEALRQRTLEEQDQVHAGSAPGETEHRAGTVDQRGTVGGHHRSVSAATGTGQAGAARQADRPAQRVLLHVPPPGCARGH